MNSQKIDESSITLRFSDDDKVIHDVGLESILEAGFPIDTKSGNDMEHLGVYLIPDAPPCSLKIIQILIAPNDATWQGVLLGLGDDGNVYVSGECGWEQYFEGKLSRENAQTEGPAESGPSNPVKTYE